MLGLDLLGHLWCTRAVWEGDLVPQDVRKSRVPVFALEWCCAVQHLVDENAQSPPVDCTSMPTALDYLWRNVFLCSNKRVCPEICYT